MKNFVLIIALLLSTRCALLGQRLPGPGTRSLPRDAQPAMVVEIITPRLSGIVDLPGFRKAVFERQRLCSPDEFSIVGEKESERTLEVTRILPERRSVEMKTADAAEPLTLTLPGTAKAADEKPATIDLVDCSTYAFLELFNEFTNRALLFSPLLPLTTFSLRASVTNASEVAALMERALEEKGIVIVPDGQQFAAVVPKEQVPSLKLHAPEAKSQSQPETAKAVASLKSGGMMPPGMIDFRGADFTGVFSIYATLINARFDLTAPRPATVLPFLYVRTKPPCSVEQAKYVLDTLFAWNGVKMVRDADGKARVVSIKEK